VRCRWEIFFYPTPELHSLNPLQHEVCLASFLYRDTEESAPRFEPLDLISFYSLQIQQAGCWPDRTAKMAVLRLQLD